MRGVVADTCIAAQLLGSVYSPCHVPRHGLASQGCSTWKREFAAATTLQGDVAAREVPCHDKY